MKQFTIECENENGAIYNEYYTKYECLHEFIEKNAHIYFNDIYHDFITWFLHTLKITKNEKCAIWLHDDLIYVYTKNKKHIYYGLS